MVAAWRADALRMESSTVRAETNGVLDRTILDELVSLFDGDRSVLYELIDVFVAEGQSQLRDLEAASAAGDAAAAQRIAHSLKSSSATLGGLPLSEACRALEQGDGDVLTVADQVVTIRDLFDRTMAELALERAR